VLILLGTVDDDVIDITREYMLTPKVFRGHKVNENNYLSLTESNRRIMRPTSMQIRGKNGEFMGYPVFLVKCVYRSIVTVLEPILNHHTSVSVV